MYEGWKLCDKLKPKVKCFRFVQYRDGSFEQRFHEHIPTHRISESSSTNVLKSLICRFTAEDGLSAEHILLSYINKRGKAPPFYYDGLTCHVVQPEAGVLRRYCGTNTKAWYDEVFSPSKFRCSSRQIVET